MHIKLTDADRRIIIFGFVLLGALKMREWKMRE